MANKIIHILGGGVTYKLRPHFSLCAEGDGTTARQLADIFKSYNSGMDIQMHLTRLAGNRKGMKTNIDVEKRIQEIVADPATKIVVLNCSLLDYDGELIIPDAFKHLDKGGRLQSRLVKTALISLTSAKKIVGTIRKHRKDIFAVAFKQTSGATEDEMYIAGLNLLKEASVNLVLANDDETHLNMIITPEEARYHVTKNREEALKNLVDMALKRSHLTFTRSTVVDGKPVPWNSPLVPDSLRKIVDYCISRGAYKPFRGATVGHFACKLSETKFLTSIRKSNFNDLDKNGLVQVITDGPDSVIAYGAKPSVGGQSQRIVFEDHRDYDAIVHFHVEKKPGSKVPTVSQREIECGSMECGRNTSNGLAKFGNLSAVFLENHGPNIVFNSSIDPQEVINFIETNFDLDSKTGGYVSLGQILQTPDTLETLRNL